MRQFFRHLRLNAGYVREVGLVMPWFTTPIDTGVRLGCFDNRLKAVACHCTTCFVLSLLVRFSVWVFYHPMVVIEKWVYDRGHRERLAEEKRRRETQEWIKSRMSNG